MGDGVVVAHTHLYQDRIRLGDLDPCGRLEDLDHGILLVDEGHLDGIRHLTLRVVPLEIPGKRHDVILPKRLIERYVPGELRTVLFSRTRNGVPRHREVRRIQHGVPNSPQPDVVRRRHLDRQDLPLPDHVLRHIDSHGGRRGIDRANGVHLRQAPIPLRVIRHPGDHHEGVGDGSRNVEAGPRREICLPVLGQLNSTECEVAPRGSDDDRVDPHQSDRTHLDPHGLPRLHGERREEVDDLGTDPDPRPEKVVSFAPGHSCRQEYARYERSPAPPPTRFARHAMAPWIPPQRRLIWGVTRIMRSR